MNVSSDLLQALAGGTVPSPQPQIQGPVYAPAQGPTPAVPSAPGPIPPMDPRMQMAQYLMMLGGGMMQPIQPGDTGLGVFGRAMGNAAKFNQEQQLQNRGMQDQAARTGILERGQRTTQQRADQEGREIGRREMSDDQKVREWEENAGLREAEAGLRKAQAGYYNRMPSTGGGAAKSKQTQLLVNAMIRADSKLPPERQKFKGDRDLALIEVTNFLEQSGTENLAYLKTQLYKAFGESMSLLDPEEKVQMFGFIDDVVNTQAEQGLRVGKPDTIDKPIEPGPDGIYSVNDKAGYDKVPIGAKVRWRGGEVFEKRAGE